MSFDDLLSDLARTLARVPDSTAAEAREAYLRACRRLDENPAEQQRIDDIADLLDAEETLYAQARAAADRGDTATAIPLLRQCAEAGAGEAAWLLAQLLEDTGDTAEAVIWYQRARDDGDDRADEKLAALRARPCPHAVADGSPQEDRDAVGRRGSRGIFVSHASGLAAPGLGHHALLMDTGGAATWAADPADSICDWLVLKIPHHGRTPGGGVPSASVPPVMIFSDPDSDHFASLADVWRAAGAAANRLAREASRDWDMARVALTLAKRFRAWEPAPATELALPGLLVFYAPQGSGKSQVAAWASHWRLHLQDHDRPCPVNLSRYLATTARWHPRRPAREPVVADVMLPPSEVPGCRPDTTVAQALELLVQSGTQALPVCEMTRVVGIVTLAGLARHISGHHGVPPMTEAIRALMRPAAVVPPGTPLPAIARAIADDGIIVVSGSGDQPDGYLTAESLLTQAPPGTSARPADPDRQPLLIPGTGAVLLDRDR